MQRRIDRLQQVCDGSLKAVDIHDPGVAAAEDVDALLRTLHYVTAGGERLTGLDANVAAWQHTRWGFAWRWLLWPLVHPIASRVYDFWARWRYRKLYGETAHSASGD